MSWRQSPSSWLTLIWPREVEGDQLRAIARVLVSSVPGPLILEAVATSEGITHRIGVPPGMTNLVTSHFRSALAGIKITESSSDADPTWTRAVRLGLSSRRRPLSIDHPEDTSRAVLSALAGAKGDEVVLLQWVLGPCLPPLVVPNQLSTRSTDSWLEALAAAPWSAPPLLDSEARTAQRHKQAEPGWRALGRIAVQAAGVSRQRQLLSQVLGALRTTSAPGVRLTARTERPAKLAGHRLPWRWPMSINISELVALSGWPIGDTTTLPVVRTLSRPLPPPKLVGKRGRIIGTATWPGGERAIALSAMDSLRHVHVLGPTGVGKSTLLLNLIVQDLEAGRGVVVIEPKGDLIQDVLARVPKQRLGDVVVLDPNDDQPVGLNPLALSGRSPDLVADQLLGVFHALYTAYWGPRTQDILHAGLLTLARTPGMTLAALPMLLSDQAFRRRLIGRLHDPLGLGSFWASFEAWSDAERVSAVAPVMNKLRPFLLRPHLRAVVGQATPRFDVRQVFTERKVLLVNLSKGVLGPEATALLGSLVVAQLWQATLERSRISRDRRHPVMVFIDEFQDYLHLPTDLAEALAEARGLGVGLHLAHQHLHQLEPAIRSAVLANARSRICFQLPADDARVMANSSETLRPEDFQGLGAFEAYASLVAEGSVQPWCSLRTDPAPGETSDPHLIRAQSRQRYGVPRGEVERELEQHLTGRRASSSSDDLRPRRRAAGGQG